MSLCDYDQRTPLHLACSNQNAKVVRFLIGKGVSVNPRDRWGRTPWDYVDEEENEGKEVAAILKE